MKCSSCLGEWTPPKNVSLSQCPFCQTDLLQMLLQKAEEQTPEIILQKLIEVYGVELLQQEQRLSAMISDVFAHDKRTKKMLLLSVKERVPQQFFALTDNCEYELRLNAMHLHLMEEAFINEDTAALILSIWQNTFDFLLPDETFEILCKEGYYGYRNSRGKMITPIKYNFAEKFKKGFAKININGLWSFIDKSGGELTTLKYDRVGDFSGEMAIVEQNGAFGFIDNIGNEVISLKYENVEPFAEGLAKVKYAGKWGLIDTKENEIAIFKYDFID